VNIPLPASVEAVRDSYTRHAFVADLTAGLTVAVVALPLAMAFAIASGVEPERGLYTAIVAGFLISALGGSRFQVGGPTGAFVVVVYGVVDKFGYSGLVIATLMAGIFLILMGLFQFGSIIKFIPYPVTTGFTAGIALIIFSSQVKDFLGLPIPKLPPDFLEQWEVYVAEAIHINHASAILAALSVVALVTLRRFVPKAPGPLMVVAVGALAAWGWSLPVETIESRFGFIPNTLPAPSLPDVTWGTVKELIPSAVTIALLGAIESLMSAVVADGMTGGRHHANRELVAQGGANIASAFMGGIPATGAIARTATNIRAGAKSPVAGMIHALMLLAFMFFAAPLIVKIPMASLAAILVVVAWNMAEIKHFKNILKAPRSDALVLVATFSLTVLVDLTVAVQVGVGLAGLLFIRRMSEVTEVAHVEGSVFDLMAGESRPLPDDVDAIADREVPDGVEVYEINGPFFFGVAERLKRTLDGIGDRPAAFILRMRFVPMIDATGIHALEEFQERCAVKGTTLILSGVAPKLEHALAVYGFVKIVGAENILPHIDAALARAAVILEDRERNAR
jgi:SulP family sulfate permease